MFISKNIQAPYPFFRYLEHVTVSPVLVLYIFDIESEKIYCELSIKLRIYDSRAGVWQTLELLKKLLKTSSFY